MIFILGVGGISVISWYILNNCHLLPISRCQATAASDQKLSQALAPGYFTYGQDSLEAAHERGDKVVLYFYAPWCASCASLDSELTEGKLKLPEGITVLRIPFDSAQDLRRQYSVNIQHTFVQVASDGRLITKWVGGEAEAFTSFIR